MVEEEMVCESEVVYDIFQLEFVNEYVELSSVFLLVIVVNILQLVNVVMNKLVLNLGN